MNLGARVTPICAVFVLPAINPLCEVFYCLLPVCGALSSSTLLLDLSCSSVRCVVFEHLVGPIMFECAVRCVRAPCCWTLAASYLMSSGVISDTSSCSYRRRYYD